MSESIKDVIVNRRTIHTYNDKPIAEDTLYDAIDCFLHAPNHRHTQPWKLLFANHEQREQLGERAIELKSKKGALSEIQKLAVRKKYLTPSHLIVLLQIRCEDNFQSKEDYAAISCGVMNMSLFLWSKNIGTKWSSGSITSETATHDLFGVDGKVFEIVGFLWAGYFDHTPRKPEKLLAKDVLI